MDRGVYGIGDVFDDGHELLSNVETSVFQMPGITAYLYGNKVVTSTCPIMIKWYVIKDYQKTLSSAISLLRKETQNVDS